MTTFRGHKPRAEAWTLTRPQSVGLDLALLAAVVAGIYVFLGLIRSDDLSKLTNAAAAGVLAALVAPPLLLLWAHGGLCCRSCGRRTRARASGARACLYVLSGVFACAAAVSYFFFGFVESSSRNATYVARSMAPSALLAAISLACAAAACRPCLPEEERVPSKQGPVVVARLVL